MSESTAAHPGPDLDPANIKDILLRGNYLTAEELRQAESAAARQGQTLVKYLLDRGSLTKPLLGQAIAESFGLNFADLESQPPAPEQVLKIPVQVAEQYHAVLAFEDAASAVVATSRPLDPGLANIAGQLLPGKKITLAYAFEADVRRLFTAYRKPLEARFVQIINSQKTVAPEILNQIFEEAIIYRASDIHFEPRETEAITRFRVDGVLQEVGSIPRPYYENILNRVKVQANLKIDEHFRAQDGSIRYKKDDSVLDIRVSIVPTINGEKVVMRLLSEYVKNLSLNELGFSPQAFRQVTEAAGRPFGMILVTGPTGSGKTTTLYALLKSFDHSDINITTIEDPVEYRIETMNQIQVNAATNLSFADGLRSVLRQDPDIILVGEIRDKDTVEVAVNAALTGHLLFSTFHANDAATAVPRLLDMGVEPYLVASTLELIVAQRLVRRVCQACRFSLAMDHNELMQKFPAAAPYFRAPQTTFYRGKGCGACKHTGFSGRVGIFEIINVDKNMQDLIVKSPSTQEIWQLARRQGLKTLFEDGLDKVKNGLTTLEELMRVAAP
jgi:type IV pilus assembly protein PilB